MADAREGLIVVGWVLFGMGIIGASRVGKCVDDASVDDGKCGGGLNLKVNVVLLKPRPPLSAPSARTIASFHAVRCETVPAFGTHNRIFSQPYNSMGPYRL
jgi:hypothetical protein